MIEAKDIIGWLIGIGVPLCGGIWAWVNKRKKRGNIKIDVNYQVIATETKEPRAVVDLPKRIEQIDPLHVIIKLTNTGEEPVTINELGLIINNERFILDFKAPFYFTSTRDPIIHGGFSESEYEASNKLGRMEGYSTNSVRIKASLFLHNVTEVFVTDIKGKRWKSNKTQLKGFYRQFDINNPIKYPDRA